MKLSEITLLRKELVKVTTEYRNFQNKMTKLEASLIKRNTLLELEVDRLKLELAARDRRMETYEKLRRILLHGLAVQCRARRLPKKDGKGGRAGGRT